MTEGSALSARQVTEVVLRQLLTRGRATGRISLSDVSEIAGGSLDPAVVDAVKKVLDLEGIELVETAPGEATATDPTSLDRAQLKAVPTAAPRPDMPGTQNVEPGSADQISEATVSTDEIEPDDEVVTLIAAELDELEDEATVNSSASRRARRVGRGKLKPVNASTLR